MKNSILLILLVTNLFAARTYLEIYESSNKDRLLLHILKLPPNLLRKISVVKIGNRNVAIANHLPRYTDFSIWIKLYKEYGFTPQIVTLSNFKKVVDFANPPVTYLEKRDGNLSVEIEAKGNYQPVVPNKTDIKRGTEKNREAKVTLFLRKKSKPLFLCNNDFWDSRFDNISIYNKESFVYKGLIDNNLTYSLVDYNVSKDDKNQSILSIIAYFKKNNLNYLKTLQKTDPFLGLYLVGDFSKDDNSHNYLIKLKWEFFNDGWYEANKILNNKKNEREINYKQLLLDMFSYNYDEQNYLINKMVISIRKKYFTQMVERYEKLLAKKERLLRDGFSVIDDTDHIRERLETMRMKKRFFDSQKGVKPDKKLYKLLNSLECIKLIDKKKVIDFALKHNINIGLQDNYIKRSDYFPEYLDNFKLNIYVAREKNGDVENDVIGIHTEIPLEFDSERGKLVKLQKENYAMKKEALIKRLKEKIDYLYYQFYYQQNNLKILKNRLKHKYKYLYHINKLISNRVTTYEGDSPANIKDLKEIEIISLNYQIILTRIEIYRILLNLYYVVGSDNINQIIIPQIRE